MVWNCHPFCRMTTRGVERAVGGAVALPVVVVIAFFFLLPVTSLLRGRSFSNAAQQEDEEQAATSPSRSLPPSLVSQGLPSMYLQMYSLF